MPSKLQKKRAQTKYYKKSKEKLSLRACKNYTANKDKNCASKEYFEAHKEQSWYIIASIMKLIRMIG